MNFKKSDYLVLAVICFFLGIALVSQVYAGKEIKKIIQPENNGVLALEVSHLTKSNADLRREIQDLTAESNEYQNSSQLQKNATEKYQDEMNRLLVIGGQSSASGQGLAIDINGRLSASQIIDLVNAIKNIGTEVISINGTRLILQTDLGQFTGTGHYEIKILGNSSLLKSAISRRGGIIDQISSKDISISVQENANMTIEGTMPPELRYAKVVKE